MLLARDNVNQDALSNYAREAANFSTNHQLPHLDFAFNHYGQADIAMFDFTSLFQAENSCRVVERMGHKLLMCLVGDSLLEVKLIIFSRYPVYGTNQSAHPHNLISVLFFVL